MRSKLEMNQLIKTYIETLGLKEFKTNEAFWNHLESRHDESILDRLDDAFIAQIDGTDEEAVYRVKNETLALSLDVSNYSTNLYANYFKWYVPPTMAADKEIPRKILDIGCDNGIVTCFYGLLFPQSIVIGIDIQENSLKCANALKEKLNLKNVSFLKLDVKEIGHYFPSHPFDLITSVRSFHEIIGFPEPPEVDSRDELLKMNVIYDEHNLVALIKNALNGEKSEFITTERLVDEDALFLWEKALEKAKLNIKNSGYIEFHELGVEQHMPILVTKKCD